MLTYTESALLVAGCLMLNAAILAFAVRTLRQARRESRMADMLRVIEGGK